MNDISETVRRRRVSDLTITFHQAMEAGACRESVRRMAEHLGGIDEHGRETPIPLTLVLDVLGLDDALWALHAVDERAARLTASDFAAHVHDVWDAAHPTDSRPADAIGAVRAWAHGRAPEAERIRAAGAARAAWAAWDAGAAWAAWAAWAARATEKRWQTRHLRAVVTGRRQPGTVRIRRAKGVAA